MAEIELPLIAGKPPLTLNQRLHWREKARRTGIVRGTVFVRAKAAKLGSHDHITVRLHFAPGDTRRRDQDNLVATLKPCLDGLVDAQVIPDDTPEYVAWYSPEIHPGPGQRRMWLEVTTDDDRSPSVDKGAAEPRANTR